MRKRNKVKQLQRVASHRKAMLSQLVTSFFYHEQINSTVAKLKVTQQLAEKLITRAKSNFSDTATKESKIHNMREVGKIITDKEVLNKLFIDIAPRYTSRKGGYTRVLRTGKRVSDASEMALLQLVEKKELTQIKDDRKQMRDMIRNRSQNKKSPSTSSEKKN